MPEEESRLVLPEVPAHLVGEGVAAWRQPVTIDTYLPDPADRYPAFLANRVYQGSSGACTRCRSTTASARRARRSAWEAVHLENPWLRLMILPELGGRIQSGTTRPTGTTSSTATT